ncbi:MAG: presqualene diphosphate synthase HpnD [Pseudomonadota bacterium]
MTTAAANRPLSSPSGSSLAHAKRHVQDVAARSGSSFLWGMRLLPKARREAMYAIYAFCREVDDIADGPESIPVRLAALGEWRREIDALFTGHPSRPTTIALMAPLEAFNLPKAEFLAILDGMEMDAREDMLAQPDEVFTLYCRRVAGAVGRLSIHAFGDASETAQELAIVEGHALQITNILRDIAEDAERGRLYLPGDLLTTAGVDPTTLERDRLTSLLHHPGVVPVCEALAARARGHFEQARSLILACDQQKMRPARIMLEIYRQLLDCLEARGWERLSMPIRVPKHLKLWIALRYGFF